MLAGFHEGQRPPLHYEVDRSPGFAAPETMCDALGTRYFEGGRFFSVKRATTFIYGTGPFQFEAVVLEHANDVEVI